jgi:hypothetical protein
MDAVLGGPRQHGHRHGLCCSRNRGMERRGAADRAQRHPIRPIRCRLSRSAPSTVPVTSRHRRPPTPGRHRARAPISDAGMSIRLDSTPEPARRSIVVRDPSPGETCGKLLVVLDQLARGRRARSSTPRRRSGPRVERACPARRDRPRRTARPAVRGRGGGPPSSGAARRSGPTLRRWWAVGGPPGNDWGHRRRRRPGGSAGSDQLSWHLRPASTRATARAGTGAGGDDRHRPS